MRPATRSTRFTAASPLGGKHRRTQPCAVALDYFDAIDQSNWWAFFPWPAAAPTKITWCSLGLDAAGNSITSGYVMYGIFEIAGTNNIYFNSVYIGGSGVASGTAGTNDTFALVSNVTTGTRFYEDNILWNARSNARWHRGSLRYFAGRAEWSHQQLQRSVCQWSWRLRGSRRRLDAAWQIGRPSVARMPTASQLTRNT